MQNIAMIILAGGLGTRMGGEKKAFLDVGGKKIIDRILDGCRPLFDEIVVATRTPEEYSFPGVTPVHDMFEARSSLTGIHAGLSQISATHAFVTACDAPFVQPELVRTLMNHVTPEDDVVIPLKEDGYMEPLCAIYSRRCLPHIEKQLAQKDFKIIGFFDNVNVKTVPVEKLRTADPQLRSFRNLNTPEDLEAARNNEK